MRNIGILLLAAWLIMQSSLTLSGYHFPYQKLVLAIVALVSGGILLINVIQTKIANLGLLLLSIWLILKSSLFLFHFDFPYSNITVAILGLVTGVLLILRK